MKRIYLSESLEFSFEKLPHTIRLVVYKNDEEWVCRKEKLKNLTSFLAIDNLHVFKGRLQLFKSGDEIDVQVNNEIVGKVSAKIFRQTLNELN